ncbi:MAG: methyl-accepting chemotaxis protein [Gammaproteobacteria bacterium]
MARTKKAHDTTLDNLPVTDNLDVLKDILEYAPINIMIADADENIVFLNRRTREILSEVEDELASYLPGFKADEVVGGSIHRYHKDPAAIKRILEGLHPGDARNGKITPGHFVFEHETRLLSDSQGNRIGYVVQWNDVTEQRAKEEEAFRLQRAVDGAQTAMMTIDRDLVITYTNEETRKLLSEHADALRAIYPGFDPDKIVGSCIDMFHKNPSHQRRLLDDPSNLPYETDIQVGPLTFHIRASAMHDLDGNYIGNTLEWADVTERRVKELEVARLQSAIQGAQTNIMLCDEDLNITFVNPAVVRMLSKRQEELRQIWPSFDPGNLVGQSIDQFHKNPAHQRTLLQDPARMPASAEIKVGDLEFRVNATMISGPDGEYMGNMVEWYDITEQKDAERQIENLVVAASMGDLEQRLDTSKYEGFMKNLGDSINQMLDAVVSPIREGTRVLQALAEGDLTENMQGEYHGEFSVLCNALNSSMHKLHDMVGEIRTAATTINSGAGEIAQGNTDLSQRTEEQASSLEETASSMEELTGTVKQNADNANQANQLAASAREQAEKGGEVVGRAVDAMAEINNSSKKIADIISVIDEIAFQTNLLALNAAVEAARAGEQGRGFAVVAGEVRNLAQRSAAAAKEIKQLINDSVEKVNEGTHLVDESGETLNEIVNAVKKVSDIIAEIAAASQEQSAGIDQVNKAVMQMDEVTQQNAALVEEAAAASESMNEQASGLTRLMEFFNIGGDATAGDSSAGMQAATPRPQQRTAGMTRRSRPAPGANPSPAQDDEWEEF